MPTPLLRAALALLPAAASAPLAAAKRGAAAPPAATPAGAPAGAPRRTALPAPDDTAALTLTSADGGTQLRLTRTRLAFTFTDRGRRKVEGDVQASTDTAARGIDGWAARLARDVTARVMRDLRLDFSLRDVRAVRADGAEVVVEFRGCARGGDQDACAPRRDGRPRDNRLTFDAPSAEAARDFAAAVERRRAALPAVPDDGARASLAPSVGARRGSDDPACEDAYRGAWTGDGGRATYCEVRTLTLAPPAQGLTVDAGSDGGVTARGADTARAVTVRAVVRAWGDDEAAARATAAAVRVETAGGVVRADGPARRDWMRPGWWAVSYEVTAPRRTAFEARTNNGGLRVAGLASRIRLQTNNGGITLDSVGGAVVARSNNGGVRATLAGRAWDAAGLPDAGLDLQANNGGATLRVPEGYSARVSVGTNSGPLTVDFPVTVQGRFDRRRLDVTLGSGGAPVRVFSNNGGARLGRAGA